jgi:hypothetical protein
MTGKDAFTDEEWTRLERAPFVAGLAITLADPGGPIEAVKESMAALKTVQAAAQAGDSGDLVHEVAKSVVEKAQQRQNPLADFKPRGAMAGEEILSELRAANELVGEKATPEEATAYREWLKSAAQDAANAAKEGGFMGFKAERVSEGEQQMLEKLAEVLS